MGTFPYQQHIASFLEFANLYYLVIYTAEFVLKFTTFGFSYFNNNYNRFDFFLVAVSYIEFAQDILGLKVFGSSASILRVSRGICP